MNVTEQPDVVSELQVLLTNALDSAAGKTTEGGVSCLVWVASHVNKVAEGYSALRRRRMIYASKLLVRPVLEATASAAAAVIEPAFLYQKAHWEYEEEKKLLTEFYKTLQRSDQPTTEVEQRLARLDTSWKRFSRQFSRLRPQVLKKPCKPKFSDVLRAAGLDESWYAQYRLYCQFEHGTLRAASGALDASTDSADGAIVAWCLLTIIGLLKKHAPVAVPDLAPLLRRVNDLGK